MKEFAPFLIAGLLYSFSFWSVSCSGGTIWKLTERLINWNLKSTHLQQPVCWGHSFTSFIYSVDNFLEVWEIMKVRREISCLLFCTSLFVTVIISISVNLNSALVRTHSHIFCILRYLLISLTVITAGIPLLLYNLFFYK